MHGVFRLSAVTLTTSRFRPHITPGSDGGILLRQQLVALRKLKGLSQEKL